MEERANELVANYKEDPADYEEEPVVDNSETRVMSRDDYKEAVAQAIVDDNLASIPEITEGGDPELEQEVKEALNNYMLGK